MYFRPALLHSTTFLFFLYRSLSSQDCSIIVQGRTKVKISGRGGPRGYFCCSIIKIFTFSIKILVICKFQGGGGARPLVPPAPHLVRPVIVVSDSIDQTLSLFPTANIAVFGDFNAHHAEWLNSNSTDAAGSHIHHFSLTPVPNPNC